MSQHGVVMGGLGGLLVELELEPVELSWSRVELGELWVLVRVWVLLGCVGDGPTSPPQVRTYK